MCIRDRLIGLSFWLIGFLIGYYSNTDKSIKPDIYRNEKIEFAMSPKSISFGLVNIDNIFWNIVINNLNVAFFVSIVGFLTGGIITILIFIWNGIIVGIIIRNAILMKMTTKFILYGFVYHGPIEVFALLWFGTIGLDGFLFYKTVFSKNIFLLPSLTRSKFLIIPLGLLLISAYLEFLLF